MIPEGITRSRAFRFNVARSLATETRPSRGPWLAIGLCSAVGSSLTTASSETLNPSPPLMTSRRGLLHPRKSVRAGESGRVPQFTPWDCDRVPPPLPRWPEECEMTVASSSVLAPSPLRVQVRRPHWSFRGCRVHSELNWHSCYGPRARLALLSRTFTFELSLAGSPRAYVEYDYVGKQSIPTTGLSPASPTALWAAGRVGKGRPAGSIELRVSPSPSKIPYGGFSPVRLQMDRQWRPSTTSQGLSAVHIRPMTPSYTPPQLQLPGIRDPRRDYPF